MVVMTMLHGYVCMCIPLTTDVLLYLNASADIVILMLMMCGRLHLEQCYVINPR